MKLEQLSSEQQARLSELRNKWLSIGLSTEIADRCAAEEGVRKAYVAAGLAPPQITVWLQSPYRGVIGAAMLDQVGAQVWDQVRAQVGAQIWDQVWDQVGAQVWDQVWDQVRAQVRDQVWDQVGAQVWDQVRAQVRDQVWRACYGQHDASWLGFYDVFHQFGIKGSERLDGLVLVAQSCGWWWPFRNAVVMTERPVKLCRDERQRLHCETGAALLYPDGWGIWAWHGVRVSRQIIEAPETLTAEQITSERNAEVRRVMLERFGQERYIRESGTKIVHKDDWGTLWRAELPGDEDLVCVEVVNSTPEPDGTFSNYWLRVHPQLRPMLLGPKGEKRYGQPQALTACNAVASTFGLRGEEYQLACQT